ncbi:hypothetical protein SCB71_20145 [Herbiconiux sp. KACC 21604]|uniref:hypothetical protein n=1 Tax=unclassified Herbiconiux TaxID=2618217 RepID=UPI001491B3D6|nr:hypothetical protein [Herbiconiux sp. SALV-R1]QJU55337.1 hypothetical protein HL652_18070 [Herbiconiux sp. SALV-R1]WPO86507.1 hypothetical protein SCB71_20145 [Herbiconiux sp. KACC 21604]
MTDGEAAEGTVDTAKHEAAAVKDTAAEQVGNVAGAAKEGAADVAVETSNQAEELFAQTQAELKEQAGVQQQRVASGLRSIGEELGSMAGASSGGGLASDLVRQASERVGGAATWLDARDPGSLLAEVKSFARRKPGTFIAAAAIAGVVAGRLTRALAGAASDAKDAAPSPTGTPAPATTAAAPATTPVAPTTPAAPAAAVPVDDTPLYTERAASFGEPGSVGSADAEGDRSDVFGEPRP